MFVVSTIHMVSRTRSTCVGHAIREVLVSSTTIRLFLAVGMEPDIYSTNVPFYSDYCGPLI